MVEAELVVVLTAEVESVCAGVLMLSDLLCGEVPLGAHQSLFVAAAQSALGLCGAAQQWLMPTGMECILVLLL
jgi:hypothetical protein